MCATLRRLHRCPCHRNAHQRILCGFLDKWFVLPCGGSPVSWPCPGAQGDVGQCMYGTGVVRRGALTVMWPVTLLSVLLFCGFAMTGCMSVSDKSDKPAHPTTSTQAPSSSREGERARPAEGAIHPAGTGTPASTGQEPDATPPPIDPGTAKTPDDQGHKPDRGRTAGNEQARRRKPDGTHRKPGRHPRTGGPPARPSPPPHPDGPTTPTREPPPPPASTPIPDPPPDPAPASPVTPAPSGAPDSENG